MGRGVPTAHLESEAEYFHRLDAELIEAMRRHRALEEEHRQMTEASQIADPRILDALDQLGYTHSTVSLLPLVPVVELAWIDGEINTVERDRLRAMARDRGVREDTPADRQLTTWLDQRPPAEFFEGTWRALDRIAMGLPEDKRNAGAKALLAACTDFAAASCVRFGWGSRICACKRERLREIARRLEQPAI